MMGLIEEGRRSWPRARRRMKRAADLALIGAAQRVEHYEIAGYSTARNLAQQLHQTAIVQLLSKSLARKRTPISC